MTDEPEKTPAEKLAEAVRRKTQADKGKGGRAPGPGGPVDRAGPGPSSQNTRPSVSRRAGSFKGR